MSAHGKSTDEASDADDMFGVNRITSESKQTTNESTPDSTISEFDRQYFGSHLGAASGDYKSTRPPTPTNIFDEQYFGETPRKSPQKANLRQKPPRSRSAKRRPRSVDKYKDVSSEIDAQYFGSVLEEPKGDVSTEVVQPPAPEADWMLREDDEASRKIEKDLYEQARRRQLHQTTLGEAGIDGTLEPVDDPPDASQVGMVDWQEGTDTPVITAPQRPPPTARPFVLNPTQDNSPEELKRIASIDRDGSLMSLHRLWSLVPKIDDTRLSRDDAVVYLSHNVIYNDGDLIALNKPLGLSSTMGGRREYSLVSLLKPLKQLIAPDADAEAHKLLLCNRLDRHVTGVTLLATSSAMARRVAEYYERRRITKDYLCITRGIPNEAEAQIRMPLMEKMFFLGNSRVRRAKIVPAVGKQIPDDLQDRTKDGVYPAVTNYKVLKFSHHCALLQCTTKSGFKHQIRSHLGLGLGTPIMGDHKYSNYSEWSHQRLPGSMLHAMGIRAQRARDLPMYLHASRMVLPQFRHGQNVIIEAPLPKFFVYTLKKLKLR